MAARSTATVSFLRGSHDGMMIEEFEGFASNLMLVHAGVRTARLLLGAGASAAAAVHSSFEAAADFAKELWQRQNSPA